MNAIVQPSASSDLYEVCTIDLHDQVDSENEIQEVAIEINGYGYTVQVKQTAARDWAYEVEDGGDVYVPHFAAGIYAKHEDECVRLTEEQSGSIEEQIHRFIRDYVKQNGTLWGFSSSDENSDLAYIIWHGDKNDPRVSRIYGGYSLHKDIFI